MKTEKRTCLICLFAMALIAISLSAHARPILFDESHGQQWPMSTEEQFSTARDELIAAGHTLSSLTGSPGAITAEALAGYEVFVTGTLNSSFTAEEVAALQAYVDGGGGVLVNHDGGWSSDSHTPSVNDFLAPYGMVMASSPDYGTGVIVEGFVDHCLTAGISTMGFDYVRELESISAPAIDLTVAGPEMMGLFDNGSGWVIVIGDDSQWSDHVNMDYGIDDFDNLTSLHNVFGYENCDPTATEATSWSGIKSLY